VFEAASRLGQESSLKVTGRVKAEERAPGGYELQVSSLEVVHSTTDFPITPKAHGHEFLFKHRHLWLRSRRPTAIMKIRHTVIDAIRRFFNDNGFTLVDTPIFAPSAGEGAQTLFSVDYFGEPMYLAQTGQLYLEAAALAYGKVYCFGPTFRAEKSKTRRHLTEFWMVEPEIAYAVLEDVMDVAEDFVCYVVERVLKEHRPELELLGQNVAALEKVKKPFYRVTYSQAAERAAGQGAAGEGSGREERPHHPVQGVDPGQGSRPRQAGRQEARAGEACGRGHRRSRGTGRTGRAGQQYPQAHGAGRQLRVGQGPRRQR
jgi:asparaginyl-tRNA synthetase